MPSSSHLRDTRSPPGEPRPDTRWETRAGFGSVWAVQKRRLFCSLSASARMRPHPPRQRNGLGLVRALCRRWCGPPMATGSARAPRPRRPRAWLRASGPPPSSAIPGGCVLHWPAPTKKGMVRRGEPPPRGAHARGSSAKPDARRLRLRGVTVGVLPKRTVFWWIARSTPPTRRQARAWRR